MWKSLISAAFAAGLLAACTPAGVETASAEPPSKTKPWFGQTRDRSVQSGPYGH